MRKSSPELTTEGLRARIKVAGIHIVEERIEMVRVLLSGALAPVWLMDARALKTVEPAVMFDAASHLSGGSHGL